MTGPIRDIEQKVLQSFFQTGSSNNSSYFHIFSLISFLEDTFIGNVLCINYISIICISDNNAVIDNNCGRLQDLLLLFKFSMVMRKDFFETYRHFGHVPSKGLASPDVAEADEALQLHSLLT